MLRPPEPTVSTTAAQIRALFLNFFAGHGHSIVKSAPLIPPNDPTLMFTNAGMVQFKDVFVGAETRPYKRATSCQKCMRVSGKHNDLEEVGRTARHHTLFEMLGNFSFGDYFKEEAIVLAWKLIKDEMALDTNKIWITVFGGAEGLPADTEARALWRKVTSLPDSRIIDKGMKDNFWAMGDTGPCGPCTEIHMDQGQGTPSLEDFDNGRVVEIWNNVFMQFDRQPGGALVPLPTPSVDTGMGLERLTALVQGQSSNYHSDLFLAILDRIAQVVGKPYQRSASEDDVSMRVIADHARATAFLVADGVQPSNEGRGYVMRRIMRRAIRHGKRLGLEDLFMPKIAAEVVQQMHGAYPELKEAASLIEKVAVTEEEGFRRTLASGLGLLSDAIAKVKKSGQSAIPGEVVFKLYDTYGFPKDLTEVIAEENTLAVDNAGFDVAMQEQKERSRGADVGQTAVAGVYKQLREQLGPNTFVGYPHENTLAPKRGKNWRLTGDFLETEVRVVGVIQNHASVAEAKSGKVEVILEPTPFYGESGGQVGDTGQLHTDAGLVAKITDSQKPLDNFTVSQLELQQGTLRVGDTVWAGYPQRLRRNTRAHHSATHLLHGALRAVLGEHVKQAGSLVDPTHLRFDFSHFAAVTPAQMRAIEAHVNTRIANQHPVVLAELSYEEARTQGAIALFGEKYTERVRVITMGDSMELCGGTHAENTGELMMLLVTREQAVQSGVRRIEAEVGEAALASAKRTHAYLQWVGATLHGAAQPMPETQDASVRPILEAAHKAWTTHQQVTEALTAQQLEPLVLPALEAGVAPWHEPVSYGYAAQMRDTWHAVSYVAQARPNDVAAFVADPEHSEHRLALALAALIQNNRDNEKLLATQLKGSRADEAQQLATQVQDVAGIPVLAAAVTGLDAAALRELADGVRSKLSSYVICLASHTADDKAALLVAVSKDLTSRLQAGSLARELAPLVGGRGGGKPELAQAGGPQASGIAAVLDKVRELAAK